jgi:hypothetical protein
VGKHPDHGLVVLVKEESLTFEIREESFDGAAHRLQFLEGNVLVEVRHGPKTPGLHAVVQHRSPSIVVGVAVDVGVLDGLLDRGSVVVLGDLRPPLQVPF